MAKKNVDKIISSGTPKQKIKLFVEDLAIKRFGGEELLSGKQAVSLFESFQTAYEVDLYNKWQKLDKKVSNSIMNLQGLKFQVLMNYSNLRGYILTWHKIEEAELLVNSILHQVEKTERIKIAQGGIGTRDMMFSDIEVDDEGYLDFKVDFERDDYKGSDGKFIDMEEKPKKTPRFSLKYVINNVRKEAEDSAVRFLSWKEATLDFMKEEKFDISTYRDLIESMTDDIHRPIIGWNKFRTDADTFLGTEIPRMDKLKSFYNITPDLNELEIDQDIYNIYLKEHLQG